MKSNLITLYYWVYQTVGHTKISVKKRWRESNIKDYTEKQNTGRKHENVVAMLQTQQNSVICSIQIPPGILLGMAPSGRSTTYRFIHSSNYNLLSTCCLEEYGVPG